MESMNMNNPMGGMNNPMMGMSNPMMGMNNPIGGMYPMMGMNDEMNDDISSRIKIIVEPYEKKIKDLEEQIRQKDFEITVLKEKLHKSENNSLKNNIQPMNPIPMQMGMGMGMGIDLPMMDMNMNLNNKANDKDKEIIDIIFRITWLNSGKNSILKRCFLDDEFGFVKKKVLKRLNIKGNADELKFIFNAKNTIPTLTIAELGITNNANIFVVNTNFSNVEISLKDEENPKDRITISFKTSYGTNLTMQLESDISIGLAIQKYLIRVGKKELIKTHEKNITFLYNAQRYRPNDTKSLKSLFKGNQGTIVVNDMNNLIGAGKYYFQ